MYPFSLYSIKFLLSGNSQFYFELLNLNIRKNMIDIKNLLTFLSTAPTQREASDFRRAGFTDMLVLIKHGSQQKSSIKILEARIMLKHLK